MRLRDSVTDKAIAVHFGYTVESFDTSRTILADSGGSIKYYLVSPGVVRGYIYDDEAVETEAAAWCMAPSFSSGQAGHTLLMDSLADAGYTWSVHKVTDGFRFTLRTPAGESIIATSHRDHVHAAALAAVKAIESKCRIPFTGTRRIQ